MKTASISDSHFYNDFSCSIYDGGGISDRLKEIDKIHLDFVDDCITRDVKIIVHSGDVFHKNNPTEYERYYAYKWMDKAVNHGIKLYICPGNHDYDFLINSFSIFKFKSLTSDMVKIITEPTLLETQGSEAPMYIIPFVKPSTIDLPKTYNIIKSLPKEAMVFGHVSIDTVAHGIEQEFDEREPIELESAELEKAKCRFLFGHIHDKSYFFLGSPIQIAFNDSPNKYYWIGEDGVNGEYHPIPQTKFHTIEIDLEKEDFESIRESDKTGFLRLIVHNASPNFFINKEMIPDSLRLVKRKIHRKEQKLEIIANHNITFRDSLLEYQKENRYEGTVRARIEKKLMDMV